jgi:hypothetical protein
LSSIKKLAVSNAECGLCLPAGRQGMRIEKENEGGIPKGIRISK